MAIRVFVYGLLIISTLSFFVSSQNEVEDIKIEEKPMLVFHDSIMYTLTNTGMARIVQSSRAERYETRDMMYDAEIITLSKNKEFTDYISADLIIKRGDIFKFLNNAKYNRENFIELNSDEIIYNSSTEIATNTKPFSGRYYQHILNGENLFFDAGKSIMRSQNAHFEVELNDNSRKK
jgi:hypothetical protein